MGERNMKKKLIISIVLVMLLIPCTIEIAGKSFDLPDQATIKNSGENKEELHYIHFSELASKMYEKKGWVPQGILEILMDLGR